jgi:hypothetical protein
MSTVANAFDELRFGPRRTLNLRSQLPTPADAAAQCEQWLRRQQVEGATEVLVITGRGQRSVGGVSPVREAIARLLPSLRRRNVIRAWSEHTAGSFVVELAPVRALREAPVVTTRPELAALEPDTLALLAELAQQQLFALGVREPSRTQIDDEMQRQFAALSPAIGSAGDAEARLQQALVRAIEELDART